MCESLGPGPESVRHRTGGAQSRARAARQGVRPVEWVGACPLPPEARGHSVRGSGRQEMNYELTQHARDVLAERHIPVEWLERVLHEPELKQRDPADATPGAPLPQDTGTRESGATRGRQHHGCPRASGECIFRPYDERQAMKLKVDREADALYLRLDDSPIVESEEVSPGVVLDFNRQNQVVGIEMLDSPSAPRS